MGVMEGAGRVKGGCGGLDERVRAIRHRTVAVYHSRESLQLTTNQWETREFVSLLRQKYRSEINEFESRIQGCENQCVK